MWVRMMGVANKKGGRGHKISRALTRAYHKELPFLDSWIRPCNILNDGLFIAISDKGMTIVFLILNQIDTTKTKLI